MKNQKTALIVTALLSLIAVSGNAQSGDQHWSGAGTISLPNGQQQGAYSVAVDVQQVSALVEKSVATVKLPDGTSETITQTTTKNASGSYAISSSFGNGGGACYGNNLCEFYIEDASSGKAVAITVVTDADGSRRDLITVLKGGKAVVILSEKLSQMK